MKPRSFTGKSTSFSVTSFHRVFGHVEMQDLGSCKTARDSRMITVRPVPDNALLLNPGKGYVQYCGADEQYTRDCIGVIYTRWAWNAVEPMEG